MLTSLSRQSLNPFRPKAVASMVVLVFAVAGCGSPHIGMSIPVARGVSVGVGSGGVSVGAGLGAGPVGAGVRVDHQGNASVGAGAGTGPVHAGVSLSDEGRVSVGTGVGVSTGDGGVHAGAGVSAAVE